MVSEIVGVASLLYEPKPREQEVAEHLDELHGLDEVVLADDVLDADLGPLGLALRDVVGDLLARFERQLRLLLLQQLEAVDRQPQVRLQLVVARPRREHRVAVAVGHTLQSKSDGLLN